MHINTIQQYFAITVLTISTSIVAAIAQADDYPKAPDGLFVSSQVIQSPTVKGAKTDNVDDYGSSSEAISRKSTPPIAPKPPINARQEPHLSKAPVMDASAKPELPIAQKPQAPILSPDMQLKTSRPVNDAAGNSPRAPNMQAPQLDKPAQSAKPTAPEQPDFPAAPTPPTQIERNTDQ